MNSHALIATHRHPQSRKGSTPMTPMVIRTGDFDSCFERAVELAAKRQVADRDAVRAGNGPVFVSEPWTYFVVRIDRAMDDMEV
jgi:hypothetical protein